MRMRARADHHSTPLSLQTATNSLFAPDFANAAHSEVAAKDLTVGPSFLTLRPP